MAVRFKFRSSSTFDSIDIGNQSFISIRDLKSEIVKKKHLNLSQDFDLVFSDSISGQGFYPSEVHWIVLNFRMNFVLRLSFCCVLCWIQSIRMRTLKFLVVRAWLSRECPQHQRHPSGISNFLYSFIQVEAVTLCGRWTSSRCIVLFYHLTE